MSNAITLRPQGQFSGYAELVEHPAFREIIINAKGGVELTHRLKAETVRERGEEVLVMTEEKILKLKMKERPRSRWLSLR